MRAASRVAGSSDEPVALRNDGVRRLWNGIVVEHFKRRRARTEDAALDREPPTRAFRCIRAWTKQRGNRALLMRCRPAEVCRGSAQPSPPRLHDEGKTGAALATRLQAPRDDRRYRSCKTARDAATQALLDGYRHEFGSLPYVEKNAEFHALPSDLRDLVLHLVAAHHGFARPVIETRGCEDAPPSALESTCRAMSRCASPGCRNAGVRGASPGGRRCCAPPTPQASRDNDEVRRSRRPERSLMGAASIPVDLFNPGQVFACLGFLEAADVLLGDAEGGFDWTDDGNAVRAERCGRLRTRSRRCWNSWPKRSRRGGDRSAMPIRLPKKDKDADER